jgi:hypothetical protein
MLGVSGAAGDRPLDAHRHVLDPEVQVRLHPLCACDTRPRRSQVVLVELDFDFQAAVGREDLRPPSSGGVPARGPFNARIAHPSKRSQK